MSTTSRILLGFLLFLAAGLYLFQQTLAERVEREYTEATEEAMVDMAQVAAAQAALQPQAAQAPLTLVVVAAAAGMHRNSKSAALVAQAW